MSDKELLELAAKGSGIGLVWSSDQESPRDSGCWSIWNPLVDDGDALRLAVKLNLDIRFVSEPDGAAVHCFGTYDDFPDCDLPHWFLHPDPYMGVRRAIVRAAAEIGRSMP